MSLVEGLVITVRVVPPNEKEISHGRCCANKVNRFWNGANGSKARHHAAEREREYWRT